MKKVAISFFVLSGSFILGAHIASANNEKIIYDLNNHQSVEYFDLEEGNDIIEIIIVDDSLTPRLARKMIQPYKLTDKTYTISKNKKNSWSISYKVSVKNNKITSAHSGSFKASQGSFSNTSITRHSNYSASAKGAWKHRAYASNLTVKAAIKNNSLIIE